MGDEKNAKVFQDCFNLKEGVNWYGGPQRRVQSWPIEKMNIDGTLPYVSRRDDNFGVAERYWLNSKGVYIYLSELVPLFVDQSANQIVCFNAKPVAPYINRNRNILDYHIIIKDDPREAHLHAINNFLGKPTGHPDARMIAEPIWTTWAKYKKDINDATVLEFAQEIRKQGYENGQLEIDDQWETCYGAQKFNPEKFSDINNTVRKLKKDNFRVTLWVHPFVNSDCQNNSDVGSENGYFVKNVNGSTSGSWWDGTDAHQIDFTNEAAAEWWKARLELLQNDPKIDSYKFDAGETDYSPQPAVYLVAENNTEKLPNWLTESYVRTCAKFGTLIEVRSGSRTQDLPIFVRMLDKDSVWVEDNGLPTLITTLLQLNMNGYTMVLPDMIGGNGYGGHMPRAEMIVRWTQANAFMPAMQFSYLPWEFNSTRFDAPAIVKKFVDLHKNYSNVIIEAMEECVRSGAPVNPPIWWIDPTDSTALACDDEFLVGEKILVAPIIKEGVRERNVYLPKGWLATLGETFEFDTFVFAILSNEQRHTSFIPGPGGLFSLLTGPQLRVFDQAKYLYMQCEQCQIKSFSPTTFVYANSLTSLNMSNSGIEVLAPKAFSRFGNIQYLYLDNNRITNVSVNAFNGLTQLYQVDLNSNLIVDLAPGFLNGLEANTISLSHNQISKLPKRVFEGVLTILNLDLQNNLIKEITYDSFAGLDVLETLELQDNLLCYLPIGTFRDLKSLVLLNLANNKLSKFPKGTFSGLRDLQTLILANNSIDVFDGTELLPIHHLNKLDISGNNIFYFDSHMILSSVPSMRYLLIENNLFYCSHLVNIIQYFKGKGVGIVTNAGKYDIQNINGIACVEDVIISAVPKAQFFKKALEESKLSTFYC
ncbi:hypothetical protein JTB14_028447 [Gonioctena quinquepunctata]|nr:hypothetical protein JTB14_028447 [Gonioctena quinquepunctata]